MDKNMQMTGIEMAPIDFSVTLDFIRYVVCLMWYAMVAIHPDAINLHNEEELGKIDKPVDS